MLHRKNTHWAASAAVALFLFLSGCSSPARLVETGNFDAAIEKSVKRLAGKKNKSENLVKAVEEAFEKATFRDMENAERLKNSGRPEDWERVYEIYRRIERRQQRIEPLLPLVAKSGVKANFRFVRTDDLAREAREEAAAFLYNDARRLLDIARRNRDRLAAREALKQLERINQYYRIYRDRDALMAEAQDLGTTYILVNMENRAPVMLPRGLEAEILQLGFGNQMNQWRIFHSSREPGRQYDYQVTFMLMDVLTTPEVMRERQYEDTKEIQDGFNYVLDERGNVKKDTAGNDIKVPRMVNIKAFVLENYQHKMVRMAGRLEFFDLRTNTLIDTQDLAAEALFENYASTFRGDERALSADSKRRIGNQPVPFPTDEWLLYEASRKVKPIIRQHLERTRLLQ